MRALGAAAISKRVSAAVESARRAIALGSISSAGVAPARAASISRRETARSYFCKPPDLADHDRQRAAFQRVLHRLEQRRRVGRAHEHEPREVEPVRDEAGAVERAVLAQREILDRQTAPPRRARP